MQRVDDASTLIKYTPASGWFTAGSSNEYNTTTHASQSSPAQMTFQFNGTYVEVFGTISPLTDRPNPVELFILDNSPPVRFAPQIDGVVHYQQRMFFSPQLDDGLHTLVMQRTVDRSESFIDYIDYTPSREGGGSSTSSSGTTTGQPQETGTPGTGETNSTGKSSALPTGALIGIIVGCIILLLLSLLVGFLYWRKRSRSRVRVYGDNISSENSIFSANVPVSPAPVTIPHSYNTSSSSQAWPSTSYDRGEERTPVSTVRREASRKGPSRFISNVGGDAEQPPPPYMNS